MKNLKLWIVQRKEEKLSFPEKDVKNKVPVSL